MLPLVPVSDTTAATGRRHMAVTVAVALRVGVYEAVREDEGVDGPVLVEEGVDVVV